MSWIANCQRSLQSAPPLTGVFLGFFGSYWQGVFRGCYGGGGGEVVGGALVEAVTWAGDGDDVGAVEESLEDGACGRGGVGGDVSDEVEDGSVEDIEPAADGFGSDGLGEVGFADPVRADEEGVAFLTDEVVGGEFVDAGAGDGWVEGEVEVFQAAGAAEAGGLSKMPALKTGDWVKSYGGWKGFTAEIHRSIGRNLGGGVLRFSRTS